jgi:hypothetical protein
MVSLNYPECRAKEVDSGTPRTVYACGSSDYAQLDGTFEKGFRCFYGLRITNEKERSKWMDERMAKGYSFCYLKNEKRENVGVFCVETQEEFNYIFEGPKTPNNCFNNEDDMQNQHWCMCVKLKDVARDGKSTCSICGGRDAYGLSTERPEDKKKTITTAST